MSFTWLNFVMTLSDLNPELTFDINVEGTKKLLKCQKKPVFKICLHVL